MISKETSLYNKLLEIKEELNFKPFTLESGLDKKLERTNNNYIFTLKKNCEYILSRNNYKAIKAIEKYNNKKENEDEEESKCGFIETYWN